MTYDDLERYVRALESLRIRFDRRLATLAAADVNTGRLTKRNSLPQLTVPSPSLSSPGRHSIDAGSDQRLSLQFVLNEYIRVCTELDGAGIQFTSLHYFLNYLQTSHPSAIEKVLIWMACEHYRY
jgi:hypothetical protein